MFNVIDLDPFGSAAYFLEDAIRAISDGGLLCVTCTDLSILCGTSMETCYSRYSSLPIHSQISHENALRIVLSTIAHTAAHQLCYIEPLASLYVDYYIRLFVRIHRKPSGSLTLITNVADLYYCNNCSSYQTSPKGIYNESTQKYTVNKFTMDKHCTFCNHQIVKSGPVWGSSLHNKSFVRKMLTFINSNQDFISTHERLTIILQNILNELDDAPYFVITSIAARYLKCQAISHKYFRSALLNAGYQYSSTHVTPDGTKTNAPFSVIWDIYREWYKKNSKTTSTSTASDVANDTKNDENTTIKEKNEENKNSDLNDFLKQPSTINVNFTLRKEVIDEKKVKHYKEAPDKWGPQKAPFKISARFFYDNEEDRNKFNNDDDNLINGIPSHFGNDVNFLKGETIIIKHDQMQLENQGFQHRGRGRRETSNRGGGYSHERRGRGRGFVVDHSERNDNKTSNNTNNESTHNQDVDHTNDNVNNNDNNTHNNDDDNVCHYWKNGFCSYGKHCKFQHPKNVLYQSRNQDTKFQNKKKENQ